MRENLHFPLPVRFAWQGGTPPFTLEVTGEDASLRRVFPDLPEREAEVFNLRTGARYAWSVADAAGQRAEGTFAAAPGPRLIAPPEREGGPVNLRDLGGLASTFGGRVRQGLVYRGSELNWEKRYSEANRDFMVRELKIRTELDLRYESQIAKAGQTESSFGPGVNWVRVPLNAYRAFEPDQAPLFRDAVRLFAHRENYPIFVHCSGGVDRTGEIAFLLNALAGVSDDDLLDEYELSSLCYFPRSRDIAYFAEWRRTLKSFAAPGAPYREAAEHYLFSIGVTTAEAAAIREILFEKEERGKQA